MISKSTFFAAGIAIVLTMAPAFAFADTGTEAEASGTENVIQCEISENGADDQGGTENAAEPGSEAEPTDDTPSASDGQVGSDQGASDVIAETGTSAPQGDSGQTGGTQQQADPQPASDPTPKGEAESPDEPGTPPAADGDSSAVDDKAANGDGVEQNAEKGNVDDSDQQGADGALDDSAPSLDDQAKESSSSTASTPKTPANESKSDTKRSSRTIGAALSILAQEDDDPEKSDESGDGDQGNLKTPEFSVDFEYEPPIAGDDVVFTPVLSNLPVSESEATYQWEVSPDNGQTWITIDNPDNIPHLTLSTSPDKPLEPQTLYVRLVVTVPGYESVVSSAQPVTVIYREASPDEPYPVEDPYPEGVGAVEADPEYDDGEGVIVDSGPVFDEPERASTSTSSSTFERTPSSSKSSRARATTTRSSASIEPVSTNNQEQAETLPRTDDSAPLAPLASLAALAFGALVVARKRLARSE